MRVINYILLAALLGLGTLTKAQPEKSPAILLQEAIYQEETKGDLDKAIELYDQVLEQAADVERLAARATYQLGLCHLKKGDDATAAKYFRKAGWDYPKQTSVAKKAKEQLQNISAVDDIIAQSYVVHYKAVEPSEDAFEILRNNYPEGVKTHHANRYRQNGQRINSICVDTKEEAEKIAEAVKQNNQLELVKVEEPKAQPGGLYEQATQAVWSTIGSLYGQTCAQAGMKNLYTNSNIYFVNSDFIRWYGGYGFYSNTTQEPISGRVPIGQISYPSVKHYDTMGNRLSTEVIPVENEKGVYQIYLDLPQALVPGQFYPYAWAIEETNKLASVPFNKDKCLLKMQNFLGMHAFEVFYLVVPNELVLEYGEKSTTVKMEDGTFKKVVADEPSKQVIGDYTVYAWEKEVQADENHIVTVNLLKRHVSGNHVCFTDNFEEGEELPIGWEKGNSVDGVSYIWDKNTGSDGNASLCLKKDVDKYFPIAQWTRKVDHTGSAKELSISAQVRARKAYKAIIDALFLDDKGEWIKHEWVSYIGAKNAGDPPANHNWKEYAGTVEIPENTKTIVIGLQMYGPGTVWFDELEAAYTTDKKETETATFTGNPDPLKAEDLIAEGWKLWGQRKLAEAEEKFKEAIHNDPENDGAYQGLGWAQFNQGKNKNAEVSFKKCIKLNPKNPAALNGLGWIAYGQDKKAEAIKWWEKAVEAQPGATAALSGLTQTYMEMEEYGKAIEYYEMWLKVEPANQDVKEGLEKAKSMMK